MHKANQTQISRNNLRIEKKKENINFEMVLYSHQIVDCWYLYIVDVLVFGGVCVKIMKIN